MLGQEILLDKIHSYNLDSFPRSVILLGDRGSGRHTLAEEVSKHLGIEQVVIKTPISYEDIEQFIVRPQPYLYLFDASLLSIKQQNVILKFLEEPLKNCYIIIVCQTKQQLLDTILNRCQLWTLEKYKQEQLQRMFPQATMAHLEIATTPGQMKEILDCSKESLEYLHSLAQKIVTSISRAGVANTLSVPERFYYGKPEKDKYNFDVFLKILILTVKRVIVENTDPTLYNIYNKTSELYNRTFIPNVSKKQLFEQYLMNLKLGV